ncbi:Neuroligin-2 [Habropoda laboriosa]|uniref:Neuroligin-2 n=1 Tax=Habropoda laboriosa TaxID=597456 RepID=A0A0L7RFQ4_9HYME|nr:Neuroligin-2 [Habropoda laboriosa]
MPIDQQIILLITAGARAGGGRRYPVIVFVHGESYEWSSGNPYDGSVLASYGGVVVVTINYRLGILGFLNANTDSHLRSPANYGLMDQIAALHWVQENIGYFGGDPGNVTLIGHGTGAACVNFLMTSHAVPDGKSIFILQIRKCVQYCTHKRPHFCTLKRPSLSPPILGDGTSKWSSSVPCETK